MNVIVLGQFPWNWDKMEGGVESTLTYLVDEMARLPDVRVQVVTCRPEISAPQTRRRGPVKVTYLPRLRLGRITFHRRDIAAIQRVIDAERPDIVHAHGTSVYAGAALQCGLPAVLTVHGVVFRELNYAVNLSQRLRGMLDAYYERRCLRRTKYLIALAPYVRREFAGVTKATTWNIPNAVSGHFFALERKPVPQTILYPGVITPRKAVHELVQAVAIVRRTLPNVRLRIAGEPYYPEYLAKVREIVDREGMEQDVEFLGFQSEDGVLREYAHASVMALASHQETLPAVVQQAMAARLPIVSTAVGGVPDIVEHGKSGLLVSPGDVQGLASALLRVLDNQTLAASLADEARQYAEAHFRADVVAGRVADVYRQILETA